MIPFAGRIARVVSEFALEEILGVSEETSAIISRGIGIGVAMAAMDVTHVGDVVATAVDTMADGN